MTDDWDLQQKTEYNLIRWRYENNKTKSDKRRWRDALKSGTSIVLGTLAIAALALFALGSTLGNQPALAIVYGHGNVVLVHHPYYGHHVLVVFTPAMS